MLRNKAFTFNNHLFLSYSNSIGYTNAQRNRVGTFMVGESLGFAWRPDNIELELRPRYNYQTVKLRLRGCSPLPKVLNL